MKKNNAFTLTEILVVMVISSIVVSLAFVILTMVQKQVILIQGNITDKEQMKQLEKVLWKDLNEANIGVLASDNMLYFPKQNDTVRYIFSENFVVRTNDSFFIPIVEKVFFLDGQQTNKGFIDGIKLTTNKTYNSKIVFVYGAKDATFYMNN